MSMKQIHARKIKDRITMLRPKLPIKNMYWEFHKMTMTIGHLCHMVILLMEIINWKYGVVTYTIYILEN